MTPPLRTLCIFGTRPEAIKMAPVVQALERHPGTEPRVCVTAQHREMLDQVLALFQVRPHHDLALMRPGQDLWSLTARVVEHLHPVLDLERPDVVLVHGDTTTTLGAALAAFYAHVPIGHVEAGLRTHDLSAPFPEEANRQLADRLSRFLFAPTAGARRALLAEGLPPNRVHVTGNTVVDALLQVRDRVRQRPPATWRGAFGAAWEAVATPAVPIILVTGHRRENLGAGFDAICTALRLLALRNPHVHIVYPVHLNPRVREPVHRHLGGLPNVHLIAPLGYEPFVALMDRCRLVLTDSGGVQEEAPSLGKPVLVMRETTERPEGVEAGTLLLVGTDAGRIVEETERLLEDPVAYESMSRRHNPYGDGYASARIVDVLVQSLRPGAGKAPAAAVSA